jgi:hypothetical protein
LRKKDWTYACRFVQVWNEFKLIVHDRFGKVIREFDTRNDWIEKNEYMYRNTLVEKKKKVFIFFYFFFWLIYIYYILYIIYYILYIIYEHFWVFLSFFFNFMSEMMDGGEVEELNFDEWTLLVVRYVWFLSLCYLKSKQYLTHTIICQSYCTNIWRLCELFYQYYVQNPNFYFYFYFGIFFYMILLVFVR